MYQLMPDQLKMSIPPHWLSYVAVTSADEASAKAVSLGGTVLKDRRSTWAPTAAWR